ncbi:hypothetical protein EJ110_NYTH25706 [Nymphaea thermarum]|nr:hypothetical protein EJ110_NYTH25706 [Nymphaea thermarum]
MKVKKRLLKSEQGRSALRQAIKVLEETVERLQNQKNELGKALEDERMQRKLEQEVVEKELTNGRELEREICQLKEEILVLKKINGSGNQGENADGKLATNVLELEEQVKRLEESLEQERHKGDLASRNMEIAKKQAEDAKKKAKEAKRLADAEKTKADQEKKRADQEKRRADLEKSKAEEHRYVAEAAKKETEKEKAKVVEERAKVEEANERASAEKKKADIEKKRADSEMKISQELRKSLEAERKKTADEKIRAENTCRMLEDERQRREVLKKELQDALSLGKENNQFGQYVAREDESRGDKSVSSSGKKIKKSPREKLLKEKLKLRMQQLEQVKRMIKVEKSKKNLLQLEVSLLKQDAVQFLRRLDILEKAFVCDVEHMNGTLLKADELADQAGVDLNCKAPKRLCSFFDQNKVEFRQGQYRTLECLNCHGPWINSRGICQTICGGSCRRVLSGTNSQLESPVGVSVQNRSQSSAIYSTTSSFSDRKLNNSQGKDVPSVATTVELGKVSLIQQPFVDKVAIGERQGGLIRQCNIGYFPDEKVAIQEKPPSAGLVPESEVENRISEEPKVKDHGDVLRSIEHLCSKNLKNNLKIEKMFRALQGEISFKRGLQAAHPLSGQKCKGRKRKHRAHKLLDGQGNDHRKKRKFSSVEDVLPVLQLSDQVKAGVGGAGRKCGGIRDVSVIDPIGSLVDKFASKDKGLGGCFEVRKPASGFNDVTDRNVLKLLEMDDSADEERYQLALKEPLSPTLPELDLYRSEEADQSISLIKKSCLNEIHATVTEDAVPSRAFDVFHAEIQPVNSNNSGEEPSGKLVPQSFKSTMDPSVTCQGPIGAELVSALVLGDAQGHGIEVEGSKKQELSTSLSFIFSESLAKDGCENDGKDENALMVLEYVKNREIGSGINTEGEVGHAHNDFTDTCSMNVDGPKISSIIDENTKCVFSGHNHSQIERKDSRTPLVSEAVDEIEPDSHQNIVNDDISFDGFLGSMEAMEISMVDLLESGDKLESATTTFLADDSCGENTPDNFEDAHKNPPKHLIIFPDIEDEAAILRMYCAFEAFISQKTYISKEACVVEELITFLSMRLDLQNKEWACVFFSLLLYNFSICLPINSRSNLMVNPSLYSSSLVDQLKDVLIVKKKDCRLELLFFLVEKFLIDGRILFFADVSCGLLVDCSNIKALTFDGREILMSSQTAPIDLIAGGSIILACICSAVDRSSFLLEASYSILRLCTKSPFWILTVLHSFSSVCGYWSFTQSGCRLVASVIQSVVSLLERGDKSREGISSLCELLITDNDRTFPPCVQCPFAKGAMSMDKAIEVLLRELQDLALQFSVHESVSLLKKRSKPCLFCLEHLGHGSDQCVSSSSCNLVDAFSLVELLAFYMGWDWTYNKVIPVIWKLLESSIADDFFAAVLILIGQLGRLGIDAAGYEEQGVEQLRCNLSEFLNQRGRCLLVQLAAVVAILNLLSIDFMKCIQKNASIDVCQSHHVEIIKKWFSELSDHEQSNALCLLMG